MHTKTPISDTYPIRTSAIVTVLFSFVFHAQIAASESTYTIVPWPLSNQLTQQTILSILHIENGSLWIATLAGVDRFDGNDFTRYRPNRPNDEFIASANILELQKTSNDRILVVTKDAGVLAYDVLNDSFLSAMPDDYRPSNQSIISSSFIDSEDNVWIGYQNGDIARLDLDSKRLKRLDFDAGGTVTNITQDQSGAIYASTNFGSIFNIDSDYNIEKLVDINAICTEFKSSLDVIEIHYDHSLWLGTKSDGVFIINLQLLTCEQLHHTAVNRAAIERSDVHQIFIDQKSDSTWVATDQGLFRVNSSMDIAYIPTSIEGKQEDEVSSVAKNPQGSLWIGTFTGLRFLVPTIFEAYRQNSNQNIRAIVSIDSHPEIGRFVATYHGLLLINSENNNHASFSDYLSNQEIIDEQIMTIQVDENGIWIGYLSAGLQYISLTGGDGFYLNTESKPNISSNSVSSILTLKDGTTLIGTYGGGLNVLARDKRVQQLTMGNNRVIMIHQLLDGSVWVGTETGLFEYHSESHTISELEFPYDAKKSTKPIVWDMLKTISGDIWFATMHHGLYVWPKTAVTDRDPTKVRSLYSPTLPFNTVFALEKDDNGYIWGATNDRLVRFDSSTKSAVLYSDRQGLPFSDFDFGVSHADSYGFLYFGGSSGYTKFDPDSAHVPAEPPQLAFTTLVLSSSKLDLLESHSSVNQVQLTHKDNYVTFNFAVMDFLDPERNQYRYKLDGFDERWIDNGSRNTATYTNLPAGDYVLRVQGANSAGIWNQEGASLNLRVLPPPWRSWWAYCLYFVATATLLWLGKRAYDSYMIERRATALATQMNRDAERAEDELQEQLEVQDQLVKSVYRHNVATLNLIADFISTQNGLDPASAYNSEAAKNINRVKALSALEECVYHHNDELLADLNKYTDIIISRLLQSAAHAPENITTINEVSSLPFPLDQASRLSILLYELLENAIQHAFPLDRTTNYLHVVFAQQQPEKHGEARYQLIVEDDGIGMPDELNPLLPSTAGLAIVHTMASQLSGALSFQSNGGSRVTLSFTSPPRASHSTETGLPVE